MKTSKYISDLIDSQLRGVNNAVRTRCTIAANGSVDFHTEFAVGHNEESLRGIARLAVATLTEFAVRESAQATELRRDMEQYPQTYGKGSRISAGLRAARHDQNAYSCDAAIKRINAFVEAVVSGGAA